MTASIPLHMHISFVQQKYYIGLTGKMQVKIEPEERVSGREVTVHGSARNVPKKHFLRGHPSKVNSGSAFSRQQLADE
ncbi:MAG: hypothetical protein VZR02_06245, partial [Lachnospiraceae bacterium]|nr:hypothetical protein [Lachnospiraceae bacterium]